MSRLRLVAIAAFALVLALPASVLAATVDATGTVTAPDGVSVAGVEVSVLEPGTDQIIATTTDETGAWALQVEAEPGAVLTFDAKGAQTRSEPDEDGCVTLTTPTGRVEVTVTELPLAPIEVPLDGAITGEVCSATATPDATAEPDQVTKPDTTPPSTDAIGVAGPGATGSGMLVVVGLLALASGGSLVLARRQHALQAGATRLHRARPIRRD